jgi:DUF4097 and DUF4098 domain-containing protein YvlB
MSTVSTVSSASLSSPSGSRIVVNGVEYYGNNNISVMSDGSVHVDNRHVTQNVHPIITINGSVKEIKQSSGDTNVNGNVGNISTVSGDITVGGNVTGNVNTTSGDISVKGSCGGSIRTISGDINQYR